MTAGQKYIQEKKDLANIDNKDLQEIIEIANQALSKKSMQKSQSESALMNKLKQNVAQKS